MGSEGVESTLDILVTAIYLLYVLNGGSTLGAHCGKKHGDTGTDIR